MLPYFAILCIPLHLNGLSEVSRITDSRSNVVRIAFSDFLCPLHCPYMAPSACCMKGLVRSNVSQCGACGVAICDSPMPCTTKTDPAVLYKQIMSRSSEGTGDYGIAASTFDE